MQPGSDAYKDLFTAMRTDLSFRGLFHKNFREYDEKLDPRKMVNSLGWETFRNKMLALFVFYKKHGHYPEVLEHGDIEDILELDRKYQRFSVEGHSRVILLGLYLKLHGWEYPEEEGLLNALIEDEDIFRLVKMTKIRELRLDFLILSLCLFKKLLGTKKFVEKFESNTDYDFYFDQLSHNHKQEFLDAMLKYCASIKDAALFLKEEVK
ncbi:MAG: hypothetical protein ACPGJV_06650 [Bacteriovoracaceae bacterium]